MSNATVATVPLLGDAIDSEALRLVFDRLSLADLLNCRPVCKLWCSFTARRQCWTNRSLSFGSLQRFCDFLGRMQAPIARTQPNMTFDGLWLDDAWKCIRSVVIKDKYCMLTSESDMELRKAFRNAVRANSTWIENIVFLSLSIEPSMELPKYMEKRLDTFGTAVYTMLMCYCKNVKMVSFGWRHLQQPLKFITMGPQNAYISINLCDLRLCADNVDIICESYWEHLKRAIKRCSQSLLKLGLPWMYPSSSARKFFAIMAHYGYKQLNTLKLDILPYSVAREHHDNRQHPDNHSLVLGKFPGLRSLALQGNVFAMSPLPLFNMTFCGQTALHELHLVFDDYTRSERARYDKLTFLSDCIRLTHLGIWDHDCVYKSEKLLSSTHCTVKRIAPLFDGVLVATQLQSIQLCLAVPENDFSALLVVLGRCLSGNFSELRISNTVMGNVTMTALRTAFERRLKTIALDCSELSAPRNTVAASIVNCFDPDVDHIVSLVLKIGLFMILTNDDDAGAPPRKRLCRTAIDISQCSTLSIMRVNEQSVLKDRIMRKQRFIDALGRRNINIAIITIDSIFISSPY